MEALYTATATATGDGRNGHTATDDGVLDVDVRIPKAMGGPGGATNPEQLFAAGYAACFHSALKVVGRPSSSTSRSPGSTTRRRSPSSRRPTRSARTPTRRAATSTSS